MSGLDDKLMEICERLDTAQVCNIHAFVGEIKQAFTDEGWVELPPRITQYDSDFKPNFMSGQEFYDRFWKELKKADEDIEPEDWADAYYVSFFLEAAKRAAGIEANEDTRRRIK